MKKTILAAIAFAMACFSSTSAAQEFTANPEFYAGVNGGVSMLSDDVCNVFKSDSDSVNVSCDETAPSFRLNGGWRFADNFAVEAGFNWYGTAEYTYTDNGGTPNNASDDSAQKLEFDGRSLDVVLLGEYGITDALSVNARLGLLYWQYDWENAGTNSTASGDDSGTDIVYGLGASYLLSDQLSANLQASRTKVESDSVESDLTSFLAGVNYRF